MIWRKFPTHHIFLFPRFRICIKIQYYVTNILCIHNKLQHNNNFFYKNDTLNLMIQIHVAVRIGAGGDTPRMLVHVNKHGKVATKYTITK